MKKLLSILMIVTMLLSMAVAAIPTSAAAADAEETLPKSTWEKPWMGMEKLNWTAIDSASKLQSLFNGTVTGTAEAPRMYYLTKDIDLRGVERKGCNPNYIILDGNGHTITFDSNYSSLFNNASNVEIRNVIFKGEVEVTNESLAFGGAVCQWDMQGYLKMSNVLSLMKIDYKRNLHTNQRVCAFATRTTGTGTELTDVVFAGSIIVGGGALVQTVGGFIGVPNGAVFTNCVNKANIILAGPTKYNATYFGVGGIAGYTDGNCSFVNCSNEAYIYYSGFRNYNVENNLPTTAKDDKVYGYVGGIMGRAIGTVSFENCTNNGIIMIGDSNFNKHNAYVGGILGGIEPKESRKNAEMSVTLDNCVNNAKIAAVSNSGNIIGGLVGITCINGPVTITDSENNGDIITYNDASVGYDYAGVGGILGYAYGAYYPLYNLTVKDTVNNGSISSNASGKAHKEIWGGFVGQGVGIANMLFENCVNTADISMPLTRGSEFIEGLGGIFGGFRCVGQNWAGIYTSTNTFKNCYNLGNLSGLKAGGIFGDNAEVNHGENSTVENLTITFENCVNAGDIFGKTIAGGIAAEVGEGGGWTVTVKNCANGGSVDANDTAGGIFGHVSAASVTEFENSVNYGVIGGEASKGAGFIANTDPAASFTGCINVGKVNAKTFAPFTNGAVSEGEGNKYLISATVYSNYDGAEGVEDGSTLIDAAAAYQIPYVASVNAILALVENSEAMDPTKYLDGGDWDALEAACTAAKAALTAEDFDILSYTQAEADVHHKALLAALATIVEKADVSGLKSAITSAESYLSDGNVYTDATLERLNKAIAAAKVVADQGELAKVAEVAACEDELQTAIEKLKKKPVPMDYTGLEEVIAAVEALNEADYTAESWAALQTALTSAKEMLTAKDQDDVDAAKSALNKAKRELEAKPVETAPPATEPAAEEGGCGGLVGGAAVVLTAVIALGAGISFKKKED